ncbi:MAG TPA: PSD1 and planctomycete cytochrome C domain-containing protein [Opitutaceae bacterium]|nr:PSD1 and planctomycete cytochrome C domain-containing protein [Opitutaceae bacterium]
MFARLSLLLVTVGSFTPLFGENAPVDYLRDIKPIITQHCVRCHGASKEEAGLRVDTAEYMKLGGDGGSLTKVRGGEDSFLIKVVEGTHEDVPIMPYKKPPLSAAEIALLKAWVAQGAPAPEEEEPGHFQHWAFVAPVRSALPEVKNKAWVRNDVDRFILARLEESNLKPSPEADRVTLLRRVSLDLIGIPPTPAEVHAFVNDTSPDAYERAVDRLLASSHYGERWGRWWLDVARYADSDGYSIDAARQIWKYRDWVVSALNRDLPFDQFTIEQLAGDLLPEPTIAQRVATGFNRNTQINQEGGIDPEQFRVEAVIDRANTYGAAFLGLTVACAQCHDHKFDPIKQSEYYQLYAFFNNTIDDGHGSGSAKGTLSFPGESGRPADFDQQFQEAKDALEAYFVTQEALITKKIAEASPEFVSKLKPNIQTALTIPWRELTLAQKRGVYFNLNGGDEVYSALNQRYAELDRIPKEVVTLVMSELPTPRETHLFINGDFTRPAQKVAPGTPVELPPLKVENPNRLDLARWTVDPANPLTARVTINRIWQQYWGHGLVQTENDFGTQGDLPSHPALLDWLATEFIAQHWSMKAMHRLIVTSATYRQASIARPDLDLEDPLNKLLARQPRLRLDAEVIRDVSLAASGLLSSKIGGPPVYPPQPDGVMTVGQTRRSWITSLGEDRYRRGLYTHVWRSTLHPAFAVFDAPDGNTTCTRRNRSNTPLQALTLLNDQQFFEFAGALSKRVQSEVTSGLPDQINYAFRLCVSRDPDAVERQRLIDLFHQQFAAAQGSDAARRSDAWLIIARVLLNLDETITRE